MILNFLVVTVSKNKKQELEEEKSCSCGGLVIPASTSWFTTMEFQEILFPLLTSASTRHAHGIHKNKTLMYIKLKMVNLVFCLT